MFKTKERSQALREALKAHLFPALIERGFTAQKHSSLFYNFFRVEEARVTGLSVQWDKYHRPRFVVNVRFAALERDANGRPGFTPRFGEQAGQWQAAESITKVFGVYSLRLHAGTGYERWFKCGWLDYMLRREACEKVARNCAALLPVMEEWIEAADDERLAHEWFRDHISYFPAARIKA
ncbi:MAG: hypothetical protein H6858_07120 [Rhodospirillales bacterium]|nr:hypothetical protein [Alphaproteobacteria bacterium]MCB9977351.1 hypothetical protein [Rhodospirillales bacterium]